MVLSRNVIATVGLLYVIAKLQRKLCDLSTYEYLLIYFCVYIIFILEILLPLVWFMPGAAIIQLNCNVGHGGVGVCSVPCSRRVAGSNPPQATSGS